jgi:FAD/FMN-containing dehydrogenase
LTGSEGTLAVVTAARLRLVPRHDERVAAVLGLASMGAAVEAVAGLRSSVPSLQAAEVMLADGMELVGAHLGVGPPLPDAHPVWLLVEAASSVDPTDELAAGVAALGGLVVDAAVASDPPGRDRLWRYREAHTEAISAAGVPHKLDVTLPAARLAEFAHRVVPLVDEVAPGSRCVLFGHVGDGNIHVNVLGPAPDDETVDDAVLRLVAELDGSISAEHGIGTAKRRWLHLNRSPAELDAFRAIKSAVDPTNTLNPNVLLPPAS